MSDNLVGQTSGAASKTLTVIVPVYNEAATIRTVIEHLVTCATDDWEIIVVDDGSTDGTTKILHDLPDIGGKIVVTPSNQGKTSAVRAGLKLAGGKWVLVHDADLEYKSEDIHRLLEAASDAAPVVYGRRPSYWHLPRRWPFAAGVLMVDVCLLLVYRRWVRDHASCFKLVPRLTLKRLKLESSGFEGCVEITAKLMRENTDIKQIPIRYDPRPTSAGKKLTASYGFVALRSVFRWRNWRSDGDGEP